LKSEEEGVETRFDVLRTLVREFGKVAARGSSGEAIGEEPVKGLSGGGGKRDDLC
jgi:hypothetical protein